MLKLNASYSKKVPAEGEYSSQSYHASIECELPDGLNANQLQERIHDTFELVRQSVEAELHGGNRQQQTGQDDSGQSETDPLSARPCPDARHHAAADRREVQCCGCPAAFQTAVFQSDQRMEGCMMETLDELRQEPHWSYSALNTYLNICQAQFMYPKSSGLRSVSRSGAPFTPH